MGIFGFPEKPFNPLKILVVVSGLEPQATAFGMQGHLLLVHLFVIAVPRALSFPLMADFNGFTTHAQPALFQKHQ